MIRDDKASRFDVKYWRPGVTNAMKEIVSVGGKTIKELNTIPTARGTSPSADSYVDAADGYALVIKSGSNISRYGELIVDGDYIEKSLFDEYVEKHIRKAAISTWSGRETYSYHRPVTERSVSAVCTGLRLTQSLARPCPTQQ